FPLGREIAQQYGHRTTLGVPLLVENKAIGCLLVRRAVVEPFTKNQIVLLQTFADQAVIAFENARLLNELRQRTDDLSESLEQQAATSEVLKVIASSSGELQPVFEAMLANATRLCEASYGAMWLRDGDAFRNAALHGPLPPDYLEQLRSGTIATADRETTMGRVTQTRQSLQIADMREDRAYLARHPLAVAAVDVAGIRTLVTVPMVKDDNLVGVISIYRQEVRPFTEKQIELLTNFASQAVIAIENTRLLNELRDSLQRQTATADVLRVMSNSPGQLVPVFNAMLENATRICEAAFGAMLLVEGDAFRRVAIHNAPPRFAQFHEKMPVVKPQQIQP